MFWQILIIIIRKIFDIIRNEGLIIGVLLLLAVLMNNTFRKLALSYSPSKGKK